MREDGKLEEKADRGKISIPAGPYGPTLYSNQNISVTAMSGLIGVVLELPFVIATVNSWLHPCNLSQHSGLLVSQGGKTITFTNDLSSFEGYLRVYRKSTAWPEKIRIECLDP